MQHGQHAFRNGLGVRSALVLSVGLTISLCFSVACLTTSAGPQNRTTNPPESSSLFLTTGEKASIQTLVPRLLRWYEFWTIPDPERDENYLANVGKPEPIQIYSVKDRVVVFVPLLRNGALLYDRNSEGLSNPTQVSWPGIDRVSDLSVLLSEPPLGATRPLIEPNSDPGYCKSEGQATVLPLGQTGYQPMSPQKQALLDQITDEAERTANRFFKPGEQVTLTISNFDIGEPEIWVLVTAPNQPGLVMSLRLNTESQDKPPVFNNVVDWNIGVPRNGIKTNDAEKIRAVAIRKVKYRAGTQTLESDG